MDDFRGKVAVVTGGASGIGRGIARALAGAGAHVVVADVDGDAAEKLAEELRGKDVRALAVVTDVRERDSVENLASLIVREHGGVDIVCNNAGVYLASDMADVSEDDWRFVMSINLDGMFRVGQIFANLMREQGRGGHIINTASVGGLMSAPFAVAYAVSKYGVVAYSEALREELAPLGIGVSTLCPGPIVTNLPSSDKLRPGGEQGSGKSQPLWDYIKEGLQPDEVGPIVLDGIRANAPYIFTHDYSEPIGARFAQIMAGFERFR
jgi:NAD(P)-dependent dehydrogenase (short-subunit alcohol dehydrogenase family)